MDGRRVDGGMSGWREGGWRDDMCYSYDVILMKPLLVAVKNNYN